MAYEYQYIPTEPVILTDMEFEDRPSGDTHELIHKHFGVDNCPICHDIPTPTTPRVRTITALEWVQLE